MRIITLRNVSLSELLRMGFQYKAVGWQEYSELSVSCTGEFQQVFFLAA
jgi:hypothetical protein